jgi:hypothetical protein
MQCLKMSLKHTFLCLSSEEKSEALVECKEDLEHNKILITKLRQEVNLITVVLIEKCLFSGVWGGTAFLTLN